VRRSRRTYYDLFSHFYDFVITLHSKDSSAELRDFPVEKARLFRDVKRQASPTGRSKLIWGVKKPEG
jgi:hypothetical protein